MEIDFLTILSNYAFPIFACIVMAKYVFEITKQNREDVQKLNEQHSQEMLVFKDEIKTALNNNTIALTKLCEKIDGKGGKT